MDKILSLEELQNDSNSIGMYAFFDLKSHRLDTPFFCQNDMFAGRHYKMAVDQPNSMLNKFKEDFEVHRLGFINLINEEYTPKWEVIIEGKLQSVVEPLD